jgi:positive regulator of sigma E activity
MGSIFMNIKFKSIFKSLYYLGIILFFLICVTFNVAALAIHIDGFLSGSLGILGFILSFYFVKRYSKKLKKEIDKINSK